MKNRLIIAVFMIIILKNMQN